MKLIDWGNGVQTNTQKGVIDWSPVHDQIQKDIVATAHSTRQRQVNEYMQEQQQKAQDMLKPMNIAKETVKGLWDSTKQVAHGIGQGLLQTGANMIDLINSRPSMQIYDKMTGRQPGQDTLSGAQVPGFDPLEQTAVNKLVTGKDSKTGQQITGEQALGAVGQTALDVATLVYTPAKELQIIKGGKFLNGVLEGGVTAGKFGLGYGASTAMQENKSAKDVAKDAVTTGLMTVPIGMVFGGVGGLFGKAKVASKVEERATEIRTNPAEIEKVIGRPKDIVDYAATRTDLNVMEVPKLGKDINGNTIVSRLEWDHTTGQGNLLMTPKATGADLAHEIGHYIDKQQPELASKFKTEVESLTGGKQNLNEDFAYAIRRIITEPEARKVAPELTRQVEDMGIKLQGMEKQVEKVAATAEGKTPAAIEQPKSEYRQGKPYLAPEEVTKLNRFDKRDYEQILKPKLDKLPEPKPGEVVVIQGGEGKWVDTDPAVAVNRGVNVDTKVYTVPESYLEKPTNAEKVARGERLLKDVEAAKARETLHAAPDAIKAEAKKVYRKAKESGMDKNAAAKEAVGRVERYEKQAERAAKNVPVLEDLLKARKRHLQGTKPRRIVKTEGINWDTVHTSEETKAILENVFKEGKDFKSERPSRTNADIIEGARAVGIDPNNPKELQAILDGMPNANTAHKLKTMMSDSASDLMNYLKGIDPANMTEAEAKLVRDKFLRTQAIAKTFSGMRTEASHLLRSFGIPMIEGENQAIAEGAIKLKQIMGETGDNPLAFMQKTQESLKKGVLGKYMDVWYNMILSGWKTWLVRNPLDNLAHIATNTISKTTSTAALEVPRYIAGLFKGLPSGIKEAGKIVFFQKELEGKYVKHGIKIEPTFKNKYVNAILSEASSRMLAAGDALAKEPIRAAQDAVDSYLVKMKKSGVSEDVALAINEAINKHETSKLLYQNKPMGNIGKVSEGLNKITNDIPALKFIAAFNRVVANVLDRKVDYMPILNLTRTFGKKYLTEEANLILKNSAIPKEMWDATRPLVMKRLKQEQMGRFMLGNFVTVGAFGMANAGRLSGGGPVNLNEKKQLMDTGWRPYSMKIGDTWVPYTYLGPLSGILSAVGSINDSMKYASASKTDNIAKLSMGLMGFAQYSMTQSFLSGVSDLFNAVAGGTGSNPQKYLQGLVLSVLPIPNFLQQTAQIFDRTSYDTSDIKDAIKYKLGMTSGLTPKLNALGEKLQSDLIYAVSPSTEKNNVQAEFEKRGLVVPMPTKNTQVAGQPMTDQQLYDYTKRRGELIQKNYQQILRSVDRQKTADDKKKEFTRWLSEIADQAKTDIQRQYRIKEPAKTAAQRITQPITLRK